VITRVSVTPASSIWSSYLPGWPAGAVLDVDDVFGTPTYSKTNSPALIFVTFPGARPTDLLVGLPESTARAWDLELARRAAGGEQDAQRARLIEQRANVRRALFRILGSNREIEDLLQDSFIETLSALCSTLSMYLHELERGES